MLNRNYPVVLLYHQVSDSAHSLIKHYNISINSKTFESHMAAIKKYFAPIGMDEFEYSYKNNIDIRKRILITFDDGYREAVNNGGSILKKYKLDSVWFINSAFYNNRAVFWLSKVMWIFDEGLLTEFIKKADIRFPGILGRLDKQSPARIDSWAKCNYSRTLEGFINEFVSYHGFDENQIAGEAGLFASSKDLKRLSSIARIGNHTSSHPNAGNITLDDFYDEVKGCHKKIRDDIAKSTRSFAFPFGKIGYHWMPCCINVLNELGYRWIFSVAADNYQKADYITKKVIPRHEVSDDITSVSGLKEFLFQKFKFL